MSNFQEYPLHTKKREDKVLTTQATFMLKSFDAAEKEFALK
jgi:hypothetical protein